MKIFQLEFVSYCFFVVILCKNLNTYFKNKFYRVQE